jgi:hypothetical protein
VKSKPTPTQALVAGFNFSLEALALPLLTPGQQDVLCQTLDDALAEHRKPGLAGLLGRVTGQARGRRSDPGDALRGFVALVNENLGAAKRPRLSEDQGDVFRGMAAGLLDLARS